MWKFISTKPKGQGRVIGHWSLWFSGQDLALSASQPHFSLWPGTKTLLQASGGQGHPRSGSSWWDFVVQLLGHVRLFVTPMDCSTSGFPILHYLLEFAQTCPLSRWCHPTISSSVTPFSSCPQFFPASGNVLIKRDQRGCAFTCSHSVSLSLSLFHLWLSPCHERNG